MIGLLVSLLGAMEVQGTGSCPAAADVEAKLGPLLPPGFVASSADRARIVEGADGNLEISLMRPDGLFIGQRRLPGSRNCAEQAEIVAVTLAVWEAHIHPEISLRLDRFARRKARRLLGTKKPTVARTARARGSRQTHDVEPASRGGELVASVRRARRRLHRPPGRALGARRRCRGPGRRRHDRRFRLHGQPHHARARRRRRSHAPRGRPAGRVPALAGDGPRDLAPAANARRRRIDDVP
jgi:hypothetical protein